jgi:hypothetical protein
MLSSTRGRPGALASVVAEAHVECLAALEAGDLDRVELIRAGHAADEADLDKIRGECKALSVTRPSFRLAASTARPLRQERPGIPLL